jgi:hypothetical protein
MGRKFWMEGAATVTLLLALSQTASASPDGRQDTIRLKVSVFNDAQVPQSVLRIAEARAHAVFGAAGVFLTWLDCGVPGHRHTESGCQDVAFPSHLSVRLVVGKQTSSDNIFGQSFLNEQGEGNYANVYMTPLSSANALVVIGEGDLLGYVVVHELGHLLLGKSSHSTEGLMRAKWDVEELREAARGDLLFTKSESERMRVRYLSAVARAENDSRKTVSSGR